MTLPTFRSLAFLSALTLAVVAAGIASAGDLPTRFFDGAAREMLSQLQRGEGWAAVSQRAHVQLVPVGKAIDCVKYRVVTNYKSGKTSNDQFVLEVEYSAETPWITLEFGMPAASGTSLAAAKKANEIVGLLDTLIPQIQGPIAEEENAELRAVAQQLVSGFMSQRSALVDLIQKDIQAIK